MSRVTIIGAGFIGGSWAALFAQHGHPVTLYDSDADALPASLDAIRASLLQLAGAGLLVGSVAEALDKIAVEPDLSAALARADYVQENAPERLDIKHALFTRLDRLSPPSAILASSSSSLTCRQICADLPGRARCLVAHPANPPHLLRSVEVVPADFTDATVTGRALSILRGVGQVPVIIGEINGFVMNRLQAALAREALELVEKGIADAAAIDAVIKHSLGPRWAFMGPFETMDLNAPGGFGDYAQRYGVAFARLFGEAFWPEAAVAAVDRDRRAEHPAHMLADRRDWRDRRLAALIGYLKQAEREPEA